MVGTFPRINRTNAHPLSWVQIPLTHHAPNHLRAICLARNGFVFGLFWFCVGEVFFLWFKLSSNCSALLCRPYDAGYELDVTLILLSLVLALLGSGALSIDHLLGI